MKVFKTVADFLLCIITPFLWVIGISVGSVLALILFIFNLFYAIFLFFTGRSVFNNLEEDEKAKEIKELNRRRQEALEAAAHAAAVDGDAPLMSGNPYVNNSFNASASAQPSPYNNPIPAAPNPAPVTPTPNTPEQDFITPDDIAYKNDIDSNKEEVNYNEIPF